MKVFDWANMNVFSSPVSWKVSCGPLFTFGIFETLFESDIPPETWWIHYGSCLFQHIQLTIQRYAAFPALLFIVESILVITTTSAPQKHLTLLSIVVKCPFVNISVTWTFSGWTWTRMHFGTIGWCKNNCEHDAS